MDFTINHLFFSNFNLWTMTLDYLPLASSWQIYSYRNKGRLYMEMIETMNTGNEVCIKKKTTQPSTQKYKQKENAQLTSLL